MESDDTPPDATIVFSTATATELVTFIARAVDKDFVHAIPRVTDRICEDRFAGLPQARVLMDAFVGRCDAMADEALARGDQDEAWHALDMVVLIQQKYVIARRMWRAFRTVNDANTSEAQKQTARAAIADLCRRWPEARTYVQQHEGVN